jgi:hypothetical protein
LEFLAVGTFSGAGASDIFPREGVIVDVLVVRVVVR